jgi:valyl-tRNA synthetase
MKIGRRLAIKVLNAAKFVYGFEPAEDRKAAHLDVLPVISELDADMLAELGTVVDTATTAYEEFDHARALEVTEQFFWTFCDDYLELVKERAYSGDASAIYALRTALDVMLRLLAPVIPFATEEVWRWTHDGSIHLAQWPALETVEPRGLLPAVSEALIGIRRAKTDAKASQKTEVVSATLAGPAMLAEAADDLKAVGRIAELTIVEADEIAVTDIVLAEAPADAAAEDA